MMKRVVGWLLLTALSLARPVQSGRGLCTFDVPENLAQTGGLHWGVYPSIQIEMREEFAPKGKLEDLIRSLSPTTPSSKKTSDDSTEVDGQEGKIIGRTEATFYTKCLFVRRGNYNYGWSVSGSGPKDEVDAVFDRLRASVKFNPDPSGEGEFNNEVRDPSGALQISLPSGFGSANGRKYSNGQIMVILTPLREAGPDTLRDFAFKYTPSGYKSYMRRNNVEMGSNTGAMILATSDDGSLESQMVMFCKGKSAVVITFIAPVKLRNQLSVMRETVAGQARWTKE